MDLRKATPIGIDLGTAYTRVAVYDGNKWRMIPDDHGNSAMPSYVAFNDSGVLVGEAARKQAPQNPTNTIFDVNRLIGRRYSDPSVQNGTSLWPFQVSASPDDRLLVDVWCKSKLLHLTPVEICSMILIQMKKNAERNLRTTIEDAVVTVPVHFNFEQRQAIRQAGMIAGLNFMQIVSAPAASALFYALNRPSKSSTVDSIINYVSGQKSKPEKRNMIIIDVGAGTVDVSVVTMKKDICKVRSTAGNIYLGGSDFDNTIVDHFINLLKSDQHTDISTIPGAVIELRTLCEQAKIALSSGTDMVPIMFCMGHLYNNVKFEFSINTSKFNELNKDLFMKCVAVIQTCIRDAKMGPNMEYEVILAGGSTRIPILKSYIHQCFKGTNLNPSEPFEDATAYGAAYQAFIRSVMENKGDRHLSLVDVIPFSLGIKSSSGMMVVELPKYTIIPTKKENSFGPYHNQTQLFFVEFYEDERRLFTMKNSLGKFDLSGNSIDPNACHFKVCLEIHENYNMTVTTEEIYSGMRKSITTTNNNIDDSRKRVREALLYKESETGINRASATKSLSSSGSSSNWDKVILAKNRSMHIEPKEYAIGVDFGTTYSCVAVWQQNSVRVIENEYGNRLTCSSVAFSDTGRLIGDAVHKEQVTANPANTIPNIKRLIGRCCDQSLLNDSKSLPFMVLSDDKKRSMLSVQYKDKKKHFLPEEIAAMILSKMKEVAEAHLGSKVTKAVVSVPACFSDTQRQAIKDAGVIAGLNVMQLLNEPTAAAIAYVFQNVSSRSSSEKTLLIFDLGGGNLDVSILKINEGTITVVAIVGDTKLGGEDFDNNMVCYFVEKLMEENKRDIKEKPRSLRRLKAACEKAKRVLSTIAQTVVEIDALDEGIDFRSAITRLKFEELNMHLFKRCIECVERCLEDAKMDRSCIDEVVLVGGSTRIPMMQHLLQEFFNGKKLCKSINADEAVVYGAAVQAAILSGNEESKKFNISQLQDVTSWSFGLESKDATIMNVVIAKHTPIPAKKELLFTNCSDNLPSFSLQVQECELESLTVFNISGITPKPKVKSKISVSLEVDESGILKLTAKDMTASVITRENNENLMISKENGNLTREEIDNMVQVAVCYKQDDEDNKKRAAELNSLEDLALRMKAEARDHCMLASGKKLEEFADEAITWLETHPYARIDEINGWKEHLEALKNEVTTKV